jgi:hypothetical protein
VRKKQRVYTESGAVSRLHTEVDGRWTLGDADADDANNERWRRVKSLLAREEERGSGKTVQTAKSLIFKSSTCEWGYMRVWDAVCIITVAAADDTRSLADEIPQKTHKKATDSHGSRLLSLASLRIASLCFALLVFT